MEHAPASLESLLHAADAELKQAASWRQSMREGPSSSDASLYLSSVDFASAGEELAASASGKETAAAGEEEHGANRASDGDRAERAESPELLDMPESSEPESSATAWSVVSSDNEQDELVVVEAQDNNNNKNNSSSSNVENEEKRRQKQQQQEEDEEEEEEEADKTATPAAAGGSSYDGSYGRDAVAVPPSLPASLSDGEIPPLPRSPPWSGSPIPAVGGPPTTTAFEESVVAANAAAAAPPPPMPDFMLSSPQVPVEEVPSMSGSASFFTTVVDPMVAATTTTTTTTAGTSGGAGAQGRLAADSSSHNGNGNGNNRNHNHGMLPKLTESMLRIGLGLTTVAGVVATGVVALSARAQLKAVRASVDALNGRFPQQQQEHQQQPQQRAPSLPSKTAVTGTTSRGHTGVAVADADVARMEKMLHALLETTMAATSSSSTSTSTSSSTSTTNQTKGGVGENNTGGSNCDSSVLLVEKALAAEAVAPGEGGGVEELVAVVDAIAGRVKDLIAGRSQLAGWHARQEAVLAAKESELSSASSAVAALRKELEGRQRACHRAESAATKLRLLLATDRRRANALEKDRAAAVRAAAEARAEAEAERERADAVEAVAAAADQQGMGRGDEEGGGPPYPSSPYYRHQHHPQSPSFYFDATPSPFHFPVAAGPASGGLLNVDAGFSEDDLVRWMVHFMNGTNLMSSI